jgi:hypothetical protein
MRIDDDDDCSISLIRHGCNTGRPNLCGKKIGTGRQIFIATAGRQGWPLLHSLGCKWVGWIAVLNGHEADVKCVIFAPSHDQWGDGDDISSYDEVRVARVRAEDTGYRFCPLIIKDFHSSTIWSIQ